ncbi:MAG TPA: hypothetical protein VNZ48_11690 [Xanthobacteraceae bacterium]|nr:hypothetical protein [Xanthobacteraceae bacterium]
MSTEQGKSHISTEGEGGVPTVVLPCPPDQFRDFIAGLLGRPQTIEGFLGGPFEVARQDVETLCHLIDQRISSQNEATLVQFTARIAYDNNSSVLLNSLYDFLSYNEVKPLTSVALHLSWTYLIKFPLKAFPEKQVIQITFGSGVGRRHFIFDERVRWLEQAYEDWPGGGMNLRIEHTDRTWGTDIESLIRGHLQLLQKTVTKARQFSNRFSGVIGFGSAAVALLICMLLGYRLTIQFAAKTMERMPKAEAPISLEVVARQLNSLTEIVASGVWTRFSLLLLVVFVATIIGSIALGVTVSDAALQPFRSFVLLTPRAITSRDAYLRALEKSWYRLAAWIVLTLALGVASNLVFYLALKYFAG